MTPDVLHLSPFASGAARWILQAAQAAIEQRGIFRLGLCGGETPRPVYTALAAAGRALPWGKVLITFGDERCVPPDDPQSNYRMAKESLFDAIKIPDVNILRIRGELPPDAAADDYENQLAKTAASGEVRYVHDLLLLGLGEDGHTASLFPGSPALDEIRRGVMSVTGLKPPLQRITMTLPLINVSRNICFLVNSPGKAGIVDDILAGKASYPATRVAPDQGTVTWILGF